MVLFWERCSKSCDGVLLQNFLLRILFLAWLLEAVIVAVCNRLANLDFRLKPQFRVFVLLKTLRDKRLANLLSSAPPGCFDRFALARTCITFLTHFDCHVLGRPGLDSWLFAKPAYSLSLPTNVVWYDLLFCFVALNVWLSPPSCRIVYMTESSAMSGKV